MIEGYSSIKSEFLPQPEKRPKSKVEQLVSLNGQRVNSFSVLHDLYTGKNQDKPIEYEPPSFEIEKKTQSKPKHIVHVKEDTRPYQDFFTPKKDKTIGNLVPYQAQVDTLLQK